MFYENLEAIWGLLLESLNIITIIFFIPHPTVCNFVLLSEYDPVNRSNMIFIFFNNYHVIFHLKYTSQTKYKWTKQGSFENFVCLSYFLSLQMHLFFPLQFFSIFWFHCSPLEKCHKKLSGFKSNETIMTPSIRAREDGSWKTMAL